MFFYAFNLDCFCLLCTNLFIVSNGILYLTFMRNTIIILFFWHLYTPLLIGKTFLSFLSLNFFSFFIIQFSILSGASKANLFLSLSKFILSILVFSCPPPFFLIIFYLIFSKNHDLNNHKFRECLCYCMLQCFMLIKSGSTKKFSTKFCICSCKIAFNIL